MITRVCISGCCWCGQRVERVAQDTPPIEHLQSHLPLYLGLRYIAEPCEHQVRGEVTQRDDGRVVVTLLPPGDQAPHPRLIGAR